MCKTIDEPKARPDVGCTELLDDLKILYGVLYNAPELNPSDIDHDDACALNADMFEAHLICKGIIDRLESNAPADLPAVAGMVRRDVLRHNKLSGNFRIKEFPARDSLPDCALIEKEYSPGVWREYGIVGIDEFSPQNANLTGSLKLGKG